MFKLRSLIKLTTGMIFMSIAVVVFLPVCILLLPSRRLRIATCNVFGHFVGAGLLWLAGVHLSRDIRHRMEATHPAIYVSNHTSVLDMFVAIWSCPLFTCGVAKKEIARIPFFGQLYLVSGHLLIDRANRTQAVEAMDKVAALVRKHRVGVWIWAEGTRSRDGRLLPLKKGFAHMALATRLPIVPVVVRGAHKVWEKNTLEVRAHKGAVSVEVLEAIPTDDWTAETLDAHIAKVHAAFAAALPPEQQPLQPMESLQPQTAAS